MNLKKNLMKSLLKKIYNNNFFLTLRNTLGLKKKPIHFGNIKKNFYISDNFLWRIDNNFTTKFIFSDLLNIYYKQLSSLMIINFYDKNSNFIKELRINPNEQNQFIVDKDSIFFKDFNDFGYFQIFSEITNFRIEENLSNRCYTGFSNNNSNYSYVHGNSYVEARSLDDQVKTKHVNLVKTSLLKNQNYLIQNDYTEFDKIELFFINPIDKKITIQINNQDKVDIKSHSIYKYVFMNKKMIRFKSNCCFLRPIVFCYKKQYFDVHHS